jgi:hypothetical protein
MPKRKLAPEIETHYSNLKTCLATTRFSTQTWKENQEYINRAVENNTLPKNIKCLYPCPVVIGETIPYNKNILVLCMCNTTNQIVAIGLIKHTAPQFNAHQVYEKAEYNRFTYMGGYQILRAEFTPEELTVIQVLETLCFKGSRHQKRLLGIKLFPQDILYTVLNRETNPFDLVGEVTQMFKRRFL